MLWTPHRITFRLLAPLHIGARKTGNVQHTRRYVTGRTLWGALTARLTRDGGGNDYAAMGAAVDAHLAFTYFYPTTCPTGVTCFPWGATEDEFEWQFLHSYVSTAINNDNAADESTLHETEYIAPQTRDGKAVYLLGYVLVRDDCQLPWQAALGKLQFGGERGYGWGRVQLQSCDASSSDCFGYAWSDLGATRPHLMLPERRPVLAHTRTETPLDGRLEVLLGRETQADAQFGGTHSDPSIAWEPGSRSPATNHLIRLSAKGIWDVVAAK